jgi:mRNA-degrading endonuclease toxin of MazEF toxin-antitoxin module
LSGLKIKPAEIWIIQHDNAKGHEQTGDHPAVVIAVHNETQLCTIVSITSNQAATRFSYTYQITHSDVNSLHFDSVAMVFKTTCASFNRFNQKIGFLEQTDYSHICTLLKRFLQL